MPTPIKIIAFPGAPNLPIFAALQEGYFLEQDLGVSIETTPSSVYQIQQFHAGVFDIAFTAFDNIVAYQEGQGAVALDGGSDFRVIMGATQIELSAIFHSSIHSSQEIRGKSLALDAVGTGFAFVFYAMLEELGLGRNDYLPVAVGATPERWQSVKDGQHIGTITIEPFTSIAKAAGFQVLRQSSQTFSAYQGGIVAARASWLKQHAKHAQGFIRGYLKGLAWTLDPNNRSQASELLLVKMPDIKPGVISAVMASLLSARSGLTPDGKVFLEGMKTVVELRKKYGTGSLDSSQLEQYLDLSHYQQVIHEG